MHTTRVEFIKLERPLLAPWLCRLAQEFFSARQRVLVLVENAEQAMALDRYMWVWEKGSFVPHVWDNGAVDSYAEPVVITTRESNSNAAQVLVTATGCSMEFARRFAHVVEFAPTYADAEVAQARKRFAQWRKDGYAPFMRA
ncbi:MAG: DNA polymerase III subunit chi [Desulfuromonadaceae bacterium]|nr:DNA polymerase III subunit chi [Geobacteraceae bacterium]